jgi:hypothetical protein
MTNLQQSLSILIERNNYPDLTKKLLNIITDSKSSSFDVNARNNLLTEQNVRRISDIKNYTLDVVVDYAQLCLEDGILTSEEIKNVTLLKLFLGIEEGDFYRNGKKSIVKEVLTKQLQLMFADGIIDAKEAILMSDMQGLFGLSYTEYEEFVQEVSNK